MLYREQARLEDLYALGLLDTANDDRFDAITKTAKRVFGVPIALVTLVDADRQWFKSCIGLELRETPRAVSFCSRAIEKEGLFVVSDARKDPRFMDNALVTGPPHIRFYAGQPVHGPKGLPIGTLCIIDRRPRRLTAEQREMLRGLAQWVQRELDASAHAPVHAELEQSASLGTYLGHVLDALPDQVAILDSEGRIKAVNATWRRFGQQNEATSDFVGTDYLAVSRAGGESAGLRVATKLEALLAGREQDFSIEYPCHGPDTQHWFRMDAVRLEGAQEVLIRHAEVTDRILAEQARLDALADREAARRVEQEAETRRVILNAVGHQINTPLTPLRLAVATMRREHPELNADLEKMDRNIDRIQRMGEAMQRAVRINSMTHVDRQEVDWQEYWKETVPAIASRLGIEVHLQVRGEGTMHLDPQWCDAALRELLENARRYGKGPFDVSADLRRRGHIQVRDHGPGVDPALRHRLFQRFSGSHDATAAGAGLGLYVVQRVAKLHGGSVTYRDAAPGSLFEIQLPRRRASTRPLHQA